MSTLSFDRPRTLAATACLGVATSLVLVAPSSVAAAESGESRARTVRDWNAIAVRTISTENAQPPAAAQVHYGMVSAAVYDALTDAVPGHASVRAAVATAAHDVLAASFPSSTSALDADLASTLATVPDGRAEDRGRALGAAAADEVVEAHLPLPSGITHTVPTTPAPGQWRPTPPAFLPMAVPWVGFVQPFLLPSPTSIDVGGPDALGSADYAADVDEVRRIGQLGSSDPGADVANAIFWNYPVGAMWNSALRDWADRADLGARATARMFALVNMTTADSIISCWRMKYDEPFWRPVTAIREADTDGNDGTTADMSWTPVVATPNYPEWPSGHACLTSSFVRGLTRITGSDAIDLTLVNPVQGTSRHFSSATTLRQQAFLSRIQLGIHFRDAMEDGYRAGRIASDRGFAAFDR